MFITTVFISFAILMKLDPTVWLPHYQFIMITISLYYPKFPNTVTKKKYYDLIQNLPLFFPQSPLGNKYITLLDEFPVTPYLDSRLSFMKWVNFMNNKLNAIMDQPPEDLYESLEKYYNQYKPKEIIEREKIKKNKKYIYFAICVLVLGISIYLYSK